MIDKTIFVYSDAQSNNALPVGRLYVELSRGKEIFSFEYDDSWLNSKASYIMDPDLSLYAGRQYAPLDKTLFGVFMDSCPDRWGKTLMKRREAINAKLEQRRPKVLTESDYLLGVYDESRMGAFRYSLEKDGDFLSNDNQLSAPPWTTLRALENASLELEDKENDNIERWLRLLLAPGSSLGGARPKASVKAPDGSLWIAKFPSRHDEWDSGAWEMVAHDLAKECGLDVPEARLESFSSYGSTYLVKRFDRNGTQRIHFSSAMALLGKTDGPGSDDASYLDIASFIRSYGSDPRHDLDELWKRIVFNMSVTNTDDHLRNHGFLLNRKGWHLSPLFDVNPGIYGDHLSLNVNEVSNLIDLDLAIEASYYFDIDKNTAVKFAAEIFGTVKNRWRKIASSYSISRNSIENMSQAF
jgi:serine/threonine-protein kinase HipA